MKQFSPLKGLNSVSDIKFTQLNCNVLNMSYFEIFDHLDLVTTSGSIRGTYEERYMGIVLNDKLRQAMVLNPEEMEHGDDEAIMDAHAKF